MPSTKDKMGRPIVVVTGLGVVTSLGAGKTDNWAKLTAGESGIRAITRFSTDGLKTRIAGTIDFLPPQSCAAALSESFADLAAEEAITESGIGSRGDFPGPLFLAVPPIEMEWPQRLALAAKSGANDKVTYTDILRVSDQFPDYHPRFLFGSVADHLAEKFGTQGLADLAVDRLRFGRERHPARRRGDPARRDRRRALHRHRRLDQSGIADPLSRCSPRCRPATTRRNRRRGPSPRTATASSWPKAPAPWCWKATNPPRRAAPRSSACWKAAARWPTRSTAPARAPTASRSSAASPMRSRMPASTPTTSTTSTRTAPARPKTTRWNISASPPVFGERMKSVPISSNKSMIGHTLSAAGAIEAVFSILTLQHQRIPPTINYDMPDPAIPLDVVPNKARDARVTHAISNSFGFGGQNVSLVMGREPA